MSKKNREKLNKFINKIDRFISIKLINKNQSKLNFKYELTKIVDF